MVRSHGPVGEIHAYKLKLNQRPLQTGWATNPDELTMKSFRRDEDTKDSGTTCRQDTLCATWNTESKGAKKRYSNTNPVLRRQTMSVLPPLRLALSTRFRPSAWELAKIEWKECTRCMYKARLRSHPAHGLSVGQALQGLTLDAAIS